MESLRTQGIVLRLYKLTETSLIVVWFTRDHGKIKTVAKGARRPKSPLRGRLDLFFCDEIQFLRSAKSELHLLQEAQLVEPFAVIRGNLPAFNVATYFVALTDAMTALENPGRELFELLEHFLAALSRPPERARPRPHGFGAGGHASHALIFAFEFQLLHALGFGPQKEKLSLRGGTAVLLEHLLADDPLKLARLKLSATQAMQLDALSLQFFSPYLKHWPAARAAAMGKK